MTQTQRRRAEMLLKVRLSEEADARRAFEEVRARQEFHRRRIAELEMAVAEQDGEARRMLAGWGNSQSCRHGPALSAYRAALAAIRAGLAEQRALLRPLEPMAAKARERLLEALSHRKAAEAFRNRLWAADGQRAERTEIAAVDDTHAVRLAAAEQAGR